MDLKENVYRVLLVSASDKFNASLRSILPEANFSPILTASGADAARRMLLERTVDLMLINSPLPDETGARLAAFAAADNGIGVLLFAKSDLYEELSSGLMEYGALTLCKPTSAQTVLQTVRLLCASRERMRKLETRNATLEEKLSEIRLVNRAKWQLITRYSMTEEAAHRYIEKLAMDRCVSKRCIAEEILQNEP